MLLDFKAGGGEILGLAPTTSIPLQHSAPTVHSAQCTHDHYPAAAAKPVLTLVLAALLHHCITAIVCIYDICVCIYLVETMS